MYVLLFPLWLQTEDMDLTDLEQWKKLLLAADKQDLCLVSSGGHIFKWHHRFLIKEAANLE